MVRVYSYIYIYLPSIHAAVCAVFKHKEEKEEKKNNVYLLYIRACISITTMSVFSACTRDEYIILPDLQ